MEIKIAERRKGSQGGESRHTVDGCESWRRRYKKKQIGIDSGYRWKLRDME